jgi:membrane fusion protein (multidrug efflux system)
MSAAPEASRSSSRSSSTPRRWIGSVALLATVAGTGGLLAAWKSASARQADADAASQPEAAESVTAAVASERAHHPTTTAIGTVLALRSISLRNEIPGTVRHAALVPGRVVEAGTVLVALDVSVEEAELRALEAQAELARTQLARTERMAERRAASAMELDNARAERDVALAQIARTKAIIARKTIRAPFRARVGIADVHVGQFLEAGTPLTTLQGVDDAAHVDFSVAQAVAARLRAGQAIRVLADADATPIEARIVAVDARVDPETRTATVRARVEDSDRAPAPGASVRVQVPIGAPQIGVVVPASALRKGPGGDHVFVLADEKGGTRAHLRQVTAGPILGDEVVILAGLKVGERVASSGSFKLREAALVAVPAPNAEPGARTLGAR